MLMQSCIKNVFFFHLSTEQILGHSEKQRYDGWYNNLAHPDWGTVGKFRKPFLIKVKFTKPKEIFPSVIK